MIKVLRAKVLHDVNRPALQIHGSLWYSTACRSRGVPLAQQPRDLHGPRRGARQSVARQILGGFEPPADEVPSDHVPDAPLPPHA